MENEKRILVVEDSIYKFAEIEKLFKKYGITNYTHTDNYVSSLKAVLESTKDNGSKIDIIILDMQFPFYIGEAPDKNQGIQFMTELNAKIDLEELEELPKIIGFSEIDFHEMYEPCHWQTEDEFFAEFVGQAKDIFGVEKLLKELLDIKE